MTALVAALFVSTAVHYTDNYVAFDSYPGKDAITRWSIPLSWALLTLAGAAGYVLWRRGHDLLGHSLLATYALTGLTTPLHYLYGTPADLPFWRNVSILCDGILGAALLAFVVRSWLALHPLWGPTEGAAGADARSA